MLRIGSVGISDVKVGTKQIVKVCIGTDVVFERRRPGHGLLCFTAVEAGSSVRLDKSGFSPPVISLLFSVDEGTNWREYKWNGKEGETVTLQEVGARVFFKAGPSGNKSLTIYEYLSFHNFVMSGKIAASGNVNSLLDADAEKDIQLSDGCFFMLFSGCTSLMAAPVLPATSLAEGCYHSMFSGCTSLVTAPALPATTLSTYCYEGMFLGCTSLTSAPALPATTLAPNCYGAMFSGCTSLVTAPELPATTLAGGCYYEMFYGCTSLMAAPALPATTLVSTCYYEMFSGCTSLKFIKLCYAGMFDANFFHKWAEEVSAEGSIYYNGTDMTRGPSAIPSGWEVVKYS